MGKERIWKILFESLVLTKNSANVIFKTVDVRENDTSLLIDSFWAFLLMNVSVYGPLNVAGRFSDWLERNRSGFVCSYFHRYSSCLLECHV